MLVPDSTSGEYGKLMEFFEQSYLDDDDFARHLSLLSLTADPRFDSALMPAKMPHSLMGSGSIRHLELSGANLFRDGDDMSYSTDNWRNLETVKAWGAYTTGAWWYRMFKEAEPSLRAIDISVASEYSVIADPESPGYNEAILLCAASLESLRLDLKGMDDYAIHLGPARQLSCLSSMQRLRYLEVSLTVVFSSPAAMEATDICDFLPPSLRSICLNETYPPWQLSISDMSPDDVISAHARLLKRSLFQLVLASGQKLPLLKRVCVVGQNEDWDFDATELEGLCAVETGDRQLFIDCVTLQSKDALRDES